MSSVLQFPTSFLRQKNKDVTPDTLPMASRCIKYMKAVIDTEMGLGLAANQCGYDYNIILVRRTSDNTIRTLINPKIQKIKGNYVTLCKEGCLSFPGLFIPIPREDVAYVNYMDEDGKDMIIKFSGIEAVCVQHEIDHLNGNLFYDRVDDTTLQVAIIQANAKGHNYDLKSLRNYK